MANPTRRTRIRWLVALPLALALLGTGYGLRLRAGNDHGSGRPLLDGEGARRAIDLEEWLAAQIERRSGGRAEADDAAAEDPEEERQGTVEEGGDFGDGELRVVRRGRRARVVVEPEILDGFEDEPIFGHIGLAYDGEGYGTDNDDPYYELDDEAAPFVEGEGGATAPSGVTEACTGNLLCVVASAAGGTPPPSLPYGSVRAWKRASERFRDGEFRAAAEGFARVAEAPMPRLPPSEVATLRRLLCVQAAAAWLADPARALGATAVRTGEDAGAASSGPCAPAVDALLGRRVRLPVEPAPEITHL